MGAKYNFERTEKKYLLTTDQFEDLLKKSAPHLIEDEFKEFTVNNIYFDNDDDLLIRRSISKPYYKEKLRLRGYNDISENELFLEIKKKHNKVVYKRRASITFDEIDDEYTFNHPDSQIEKEIDYFIKRYAPKPKYYIGYKRSAYKDSEDPHLRITFDKDITYRLEDLDLRSGFYGKSLLDEDEIIMEIKTIAAMPLWLVGALNELKIYPTSYSKVGNIYKKELTESRGIRL
mgnify:CR=1 FL=1